MRLWSLHPRYLDPKGLVALWREALLAQAVLRGETRGYRNHPQLERFLGAEDSLAAISLYLGEVYEESLRRGYSFNREKIQPAKRNVTLWVTSGQIAYEWSHLLGKLKGRHPELYERWSAMDSPQTHPLFLLRGGEVESWERL